MTVCCEHNRCPGRPRWFLGRFQARPWRCPQCARWWVTKWHISYADDGSWQWTEADTPADDPIPRSTG